MNKDKLAEHFDSLIQDINRLREAGQKEYAGGENAFGNFERLAKLLHTDRKKILLTYMMKHIDGIFAYVNGHRSQRESIHGRIQDAIVYLMILDGMVHEESVAHLKQPIGIEYE